MHVRVFFSVEVLRSQSSWTRVDNILHAIIIIYTITQRRYEYSKIYDFNFRTFVRSLGMPMLRRRRRRRRRVPAGAYVLSLPPAGRVRLGPTVRSSAVGTVGPTVKFRANGRRVRTVVTPKKSPLLYIFNRT